MKPAKSANTLAGPAAQQPKINGQQQNSNAAPTSPICRCRVMYLGSSVPHITKDGLQGIQEPLRELYPDKASLDQGNAGIDSWLSVWSNGILIENVDETGREVKRFFKIEALHYCAAVKFVPQISATQTLPADQGNLAGLPRFLPLDSPHARLQQNSAHPPIFASILRRTTGVKVLECHAFICKREAAANALVRCCFHAYADTMYAKQIGAEIDNIGSPNNNGTNQLQGQHPNGTLKHNGAPAITARRSKSIAALNDAENETSGEFSDTSSRHQRQQQQYSNLVSRRKSLNNGNYAQGADPSQQQQSIYSNHPSNLQKQQNFSKSLHHLNQPDYERARFDDFADGSMHSNQSTSYRNLSSTKHISKSQLQQQQQVSGGAGVPEPFFNPYSSRVPSYPPQNIIDQQQTSTGTLRSVKSVAANSIASTLLRSKKHAKAMSMAQLNQSNAQLNQIANERVTSFHQPHNFHQQQMAATMGPGSFMTMPPVPPMFLPNIHRLPQINGSQTMKLPGRHNQHGVMPGQMPPINFEAMTPKEMKKLLKKSAKYGIDPSRFTDNGLPMLPLRPMPMPVPLQMQPAPPPPMMPPAQMPAPAGNKSGTLGSQSLYSMDMHHSDVPDYSSQTLAYGSSLGLPPPPPLPPDGCQGSPMQPIKSILVKPNPEFLKSKAGKKWLKQQKEFKKLLPPHLDGLPIVFGPPPLDALEPADASAANGAMQPPPQFLQPPPPPSMMAPPPTSLGLPVMDANGYYNPHPFYGHPSGRASAASTLLRYSPRSQMMHQQQQHQMQQQQENGAIGGGPHEQQQLDYVQRHQAQGLYSDPSMLINQQRHSKAMLMMHQANGGEPMYSSQLGAYNGQFPFNSERDLPPAQRERARNHMVEQSVISLGDENDCDEDDEADIRRGDDDDEVQNDGYYDRVGSTSSRSTSQQPHRTRRHHHQHGSTDGRSITEQQASDYSENDSQYQQQQSIGQQQAGEDHNGYSAGIYRRKHINERAFSYSIRQEHKSNGGGGGDTSQSEADYVTDDGADYADSRQNYQQQRRDGNNNNRNYQGQPQQRTYDSPQTLQPGGYQSRSQSQYARNSLQQQQQQHYHQPPPPPPPVDMDLSARLEQQLNMKSFVNSAVKSHM